MEKVNRCFFAFIYLFIMFYGFQCSWLSILLMGSIALACFLCWVRIFNIIYYILLYITLEVLMTFKCNFVTCNILFHLVLMIGLIYWIEWLWIRFKKKYLTTHLPLWVILHLSIEICCWLVCLNSMSWIWNAENYKFCKQLTC